MKISGFLIPKITESINSNCKEEMKSTLQMLKEQLLEEASKISKTTIKSQQNKKSNKKS